MPSGMGTVHFCLVSGCITIKDWPGEVPGGTVTEMVDGLAGIAGIAGIGTFNSAMSCESAAMN